MYRPRTDHRNAMYRRLRLRYGEMEREGVMERDAIFAHGLTDFLRKRLLADQEASIKPAKEQKR